MSTSFSRLGLINAALLAQGQTELTVENDGSLEWRMLAAQWPLIVESELEDGGYAHLFIEQEIETGTQPGRFGYTDRYKIPTDLLHVRRVFTAADDGTHTYYDEWYQDATGVNVNVAGGIWIEAVEAVDAADFSPLFATGIQRKLEMHIARALKEEHALADRLEQEAEVSLQRARTSAANKSGPQPLFRPDSVFTRARFRRG